MESWVESDQMMAYLLACMHVEMEVVVEVEEVEDQAGDGFGCVCSGALVHLGGSQR